MNCYLCKKETTEFGTMYVEKVCLECTDKHLEAQRQREAFMKQYNIDHAACPNPNCNSTSFISTLAGFAYNSDRPDEYKNLNDSTCTKCGNKHTVHDRVPQKNNP